ncbi:Sensor histidine kinase ResE (plasmid) [Sulfitobacter sp. DSM 110093]|uniref:sensor histidine kinase n=1 Tax=Sulfitobacter sp. DSM 110093 TaxID=2883127 RepID=UPI001FABACC3|nr:ATP-binding protein [Sulfitobacter sp. DSM 110093]UOA33841.1 Sensor histidine kinase ResE [Sulfitobacter sp. DSM 110093]
MNHFPNAPANFDDPLRQLYMLAIEPDLTFEDKVAQLLALGTDALGLELGIVSRIEHPIYECLFVHGPEWAPASGTTFNVNGTYCLYTLNNDEVTAFHHAGKQEISSHPCYQNFGLESYIGAPLRCENEFFGTLNFSDRAPRQAPFRQKEFEFVAFLARWLGNELKLHAERRELRGQRGLLSAMIDAVPEAIVLADLNRSVAMVNPAVETLFGYAPHQILGRQTAVLYGTLDSYERAGEEKFNPRASSKRGEFEISCRRSDGSTFDGLVSSAKVETDWGETLGFLAVVRDISEQRAFEHAKDQLIATVSHDIKNPLSALCGALEVLDAHKPELDEAKTKLLRLALRNARRIDEMVADILDVEQLRAGEPSGFAVVPLAPLLSQAIETLTSYAENHGIGLKLKLSDAPNQPLRLHASRVERLISNLATNAIKASAKGGTVELGLTSTGHGFYVKDEGAGLPHSIQKTLFKPFARGDTYRVNEGYGLGMGIVKAIVDQHLGEITFETAEGEGTTFTVDFPVSEPIGKEEGHPKYL